MFRTRRIRSQVMPIFAVALFVLLVFATLTLDGSMMQQSQRDMEVIAQHAARAGAQQINWSSYNTNCSAFIRANTYTDGAGKLHTPVAADCNSFLVLDAAAATTAATNAANSWMTQLTSQNINLPGFKPKVSAQVSVKMGTGNKNITVTVRRCYQPFLLKYLLDSTDCPRATLAAASYTGDPLAGQ